MDTSNKEEDEGYGYHEEVCVGKGGWVTSQNYRVQISSWIS